MSSTSTSYGLNLAVVEINDGFLYILMLQNWEKTYVEGCAFGMHSRDVIQFRHSAVEERKSAEMFGSRIRV